MGFSRQEYWSRMPSPSPSILYTRCLLTPLLKRQITVMDVGQWRPPLLVTCFCPIIREGGDKDKIVLNEHRQESAIQGSFEGTPAWDLSAFYHIRVIMTCLCDFPLMWALFYPWPISRLHPGPSTTQNPNAALLSPTSPLLWAVLPHPPRLGLPLRDYRNLLLRLLGRWGLGRRTFSLLWRGAFSRRVPSCRWLVRFMLIPWGAPRG